MVYVASLSTTYLANDSAVSVKESLNSSRHKSVSAQLPYIECDGHSECAKLRALGVMPGESKLKATKKTATAKNPAVTNPYTQHPRKVEKFVTKPYENRGWGKLG